jgi:hypothetical protein
MFGTLFLKRAPVKQAPLPVFLGLFIYLDLTR